MATLFLDLNPRLVFTGALAFIALALLLLGVGLLLRATRQGRSRIVVDKALAAREGQRAREAELLPDADGRLEAVRRFAETMGGRLEHGRLGDSLLAEEDRKLIDLCGFADIGRARALFIAVRALLAVLLPVIALVVLGDRTLLHGSSLLTQAAALFAGFAFGWMLPKWILMRLARRRRLAAIEELPLLIDLVRLLQGVGLSMDQSLHIVVNEFKDVLPVLADELRSATDQYARGRSREQSLARLMYAFDHDDLNAVCRLIIQVDRHGGAVQEPLGRFGERVRERRKLELKERVARTTVKMTGVMVVTLLPALLIVTGGAGLLAVLRGLAHVTGAGS
jgi:tight adherence protein C